MAGSSERSSVVSALIGAFSTAAVGALLAWLTPFWGWLWNAIAIFWAHLGGVSNWPNWIAYLLAVVSVVSIASSALRWRRNNADSFTRFSELTYLGSHWTWSYLSGTPVGVSSYCPHCSTRLVYENRHSFTPNVPDQVLLHCERCNTNCTIQEGDLKHLIARVEREIDRIIRTDEWRTRVPTK